MAIAIVEELWTRIRAAIDDKIVAATDARDQAVTAKDGAVTAQTAAETAAANAATVAAAKAVEEVDKLKAGAPAAFDTLLEIANELGENETERAALTNSIAGKAPVSHNHTVEQVTGLQGELDGKAPVSHNHTVEQVTGLQGELDGKAPVSHNHTMANITDLPPITNWIREGDAPLRQVSGNLSVPATPGYLDAASSKRYVDQEVAKKANASHTHTSANITDATTFSNGPAQAGQVMKLSEDGFFHQGPMPTADNHLTRKGYVDGRTPNVRVVSALPTSPVAGVVYLVTG